MPTLSDLSRSLLTKLGLSVEGTQPCNRCLLWAGGNIDSAIHDLVDDDSLLSEESVMVRMEDLSISEDYALVEEWVMDLDTDTNVGGAGGDDTLRKEKPRWVWTIVKGTTFVDKSSNSVVHACLDCYIERANRIVDRKIDAQGFSKSFVSRVFSGLRDEPLRGPYTVGKHQKLWQKYGADAMTDKQSSEEAAVTTDLMRLIQALNPTAVAIKSLTDASDQSVLQVRRML